MLRSWEFRLSTRVVFGRGSAVRLGKLARELGRSAVLVGYADPERLEPAYARAALLLREAGLEVTRLHCVRPEPEAEVAIDGARLAQDAGADVVVALGGGSVIDAAKGIAALARMGGSPWEYAEANTLGRPVTDALPLVTVPTTAGTGSEVSAVAVFAFRAPGELPEVPLKTALYGPALCPSVALVDPDLTVGSPPALTAASGADALGHAIEAYISRRANPISSTLAARAVALIVGHLSRAVAAPDDPEPREPLALAATLAGAAFNEAGVVVTHAMAHALGALLGVGHGLAVAVATPVALRFNAERCVAQYAELAESCGLAGASAEEKAARFVGTITDLLGSVGLPERVSVPANAPADLLDRLVRNAMANTPIAVTCNPRKVNQPVWKDLLGQCLDWAS